MKAWTDIEQSRKLAEILQLESADMIWDLTNPDLPTIRAIPYEDSDYNNKYLNIISAWSLAALLNILPSGKALIHDKGSYGYKCICKNIDSYLYDNPVDACVDMIIKLHEQKLI